MVNREKVIIDTDPGHDDALAILFAIKSGEFDVQALTTVAGNSTIKNVTRNAQAILGLGGYSTPIFSGRPAPLKRKLVTAKVHGRSGLDGFDTGKTKFKLTGDAPARIVELVHQSPGQISILAIGPLTNLARAFLLDSELPNLIKQVVIMGGAINVPGNKSPFAEFNFFVDPEAAKIVFDAAVPKVLIPLDLCNRVVLQLSDFQIIKNKKIHGALMLMMKNFDRELRKNEATKGILVYDALAAYFLLNPDAFTLRPMSLTIETNDKEKFGMVLKLKNQKPNVIVATSLDQQQFIKDFTDALSE
ncbi:MAG: nucleoside hydrolase [bacterium]|nr:nucleoside hydrolase [bacterium]